MKKVLLMVIGLAFMATAANATGPIAQIGLYGDAGHSVMEFMGAAGFDLYVFINPSDNAQPQYWPRGSRGTIFVPLTWMTLLAALESPYP